MWLCTFSIITSVIFSSRFPQTQDYILPSKRPPSAVGSETRTWKLADGYEPQDIVVWDPVTETVVETMSGKRFRF